MLIERIAQGLLFTVLFVCVVIGIAAASNSALSVLKSAVLWGIGG